MMTDRAPVFWLTIRQFLDGRSIRIVALLAAAPLLLGGIELIASGSESDATRFLGPLTNELSIPTLLPLIALILASTAFSNEVADRTLPYLVLKPRSRFQLVLEKTSATIITGTLISLVFVFIVWGVLSGVGQTVDGELLAAMLLASTLAIAAYGAAFSLLSLVLQRVLLAGLLYIMFWESLLARFIPGIRLLSIRHYVQSLFAHVVDDHRVTIAQQTAVGTSIIVLTAIVALGVILSYVRLQRMDLD